MDRAAVVIVTRVRLGAMWMLAVTNRAHGGLTFPGGKAHDNESQRDAAVRELDEEVGMVALPNDLVQLAHGVNVHRGSSCDVVVYFARAVWGMPRNQEAGTSFVWITWDDFRVQTPFRSFYDRHFPDGIEHLRATIFQGGKP